MCTLLLMSFTCLTFSLARSFLRDEKTYLLLANVMDTAATVDVSDVLFESGTFNTIITNMLSTRKEG